MKIKLFFPYFKPHIKLLIACLIFMFLFAAISSLSLSLLSPCLRAIFYKYTFPQGNDFLVKFSNWFLRGSRAQAFIKLQIGVLITFFATGVFRYLHEYLGALIEEKVMKKIRDDTYSHLHSLSLDYFHQSEPGVLVSRITNDVSLIKGTAKEGILRFTQQFLLTIAYLIFALYISWQLLLLTIITFPALGWLINKLSKKLREKSDQVQEDMGKITSMIEESISGIKVVKAFFSHEFEVHKFLKSTYNYFKSAIKFEKIGAIGVPISEFIAAIGICIILTGYLVFMSSTISPDKFFIFLGCILLMLQALKQLPKANVGMQKGVQAMIRIKRILDVTPTVKETIKPIPLKSFKHEIKFNKVYFGYNNQRNVIHGVTLSIKKGERVAFVGPSGAGKSTLTDLLARFYDPIEGSIEIDGIDIRKIRIRDLRNLIGLVTQEPILFNDTVFNNITYGSSIVSQELVYNAAKLANAHEFIEKLPQGYHTIIGGKGKFLSGGERQRIAIARALYKNPEILIFDEATSHLDPESESKIQQAIKNMLKNRTALVIAHRLSTIRDCERIIVMDNGKIVEEGTYGEVLKNNKLCQNFFNE